MEQAWRREGRATPACGAGARMAERVRLEEEEPAQRPRFLAKRGHSLPVKTGSTAKNAKNAEKNRDGYNKVKASRQTRVGSCRRIVLCG